MSKTQRGLGDLLSRESLMSLQVAAAATLLVPNVLVYLIGPEFRAYERWVALAVAILIAVVVTERSPSDWRWWIVVILNGMLIYSSAVGLTQMLSPRTGIMDGASAPPTEGGSVERLPFFHSWYP